MYNLPIYLEIEIFPESLALVVSVNIRVMRSIFNNQKKNQENNTYAFYFFQKNKAICTMHIKSVNRTISENTKPSPRDTTGEILHKCVLNRFYK